MIENALWRSGGTNTTNIITSQMYEYEGKGSTKGYIGLMGLSDYGYASSGCYNGEKTLYYYNNSTCINTNWLKGLSEWSITRDSAQDTHVYPVISHGQLATTNRTLDILVVRPVLYLKSTVKITGGTGTSGDPYILGM